jgi:hypothetical protein
LGSDALPSTLGRYYAILVGTIAGGLVIGYFAVAKQSDALIMLAIVWALAGSICLMRVRCPNCDATVARTGKVAGMPYASAFAGSRCRHCGFDLRRRRT